MGGTALEAFYNELKRRAAGRSNTLSPSRPRARKRSAAAGGQGRAESWARSKVDHDGPGRRNESTPAAVMAEEGCAARSLSEGRDRRVRYMVAGGVPRRRCRLHAGLGGCCALEKRLRQLLQRGQQIRAAGVGRLLRQPDHRAEGTLQHAQPGRGDIRGYAQPNCCPGGQRGSEGSGLSIRYTCWNADA